jgi:hypothetical protein
MANNLPVEQERLDPAPAPVPGAFQRVLLLYFLALIAFVPLWQLGMEIIQHKPIQAAEVFRQVPTQERLTAYERALESNSVVAEAVRQRLQWLGLVVLQAGNQKALVGPHWSLFYQPSVESVLRPGFMARPEAPGHPLPAIVAFHEALAAQGVELIVLAVPGKEAIYPEWLQPRYPQANGPACSPHLRLLAERLRQRGIKFVDPTNRLWAQKHSQPLYLRHDTHWTPQGLKLVAEELARQVDWPGIEGRKYRLQEVPVTAPGDLLEMLKLPELPTPFTPERVIMHRVLHVLTGQPVEPDTQSPVVLLGDSFSNIYSAPEMGWGDHGGLSEQLAYLLNRTVDLIAMNDGGVNRTRVTLARRQNPLQGKQVVIWQFAARDLVVSNGQWEIISLDKTQGSKP